MLYAYVRNVICITLDYSLHGSSVDPLVVNDGSECDSERVSDLKFIFKVKLNLFNTYFQYQILNSFVVLYKCKYLEKEKISFSKAPDIKREMEQLDPFQNFNVVNKETTNYFRTRVGMGEILEIHCS